VWRRQGSSVDTAVVEAQVTADRSRDLADAVVAFARAAGCNRSLCDGHHIGQGLPVGTLAPMDAGKSPGSNRGEE
jgi:hypothetical protein